ncbi:MAG: hypothetical protein ACM3QZ_06445 [Solirubrobacterales bacterium]
MENVFKRSEILDGQEVFLLNIDNWRSRDAIPSIDGVPLAEGELVRTALQLVDFIHEHPGFELAFFKVRFGPTKWSWLFNLTYTTKEGLQRVQIEQTTCEQCHTQLCVANPTIPDLYLMVPNWQVAMNRGWSQPVVSCPTCGGGLERHAVWTEHAWEHGDGVSVPKCPE